MASPTDLLARDALIDIADWSDAPERRPLFGDDAAVLRVVVFLWLALTAWKLWLALVANVVWEEGHFAVSGQHPALAYPDIPAGWPLFARACTELFGWSPPALRIPGIAVAQAVPVGVWFMSRPLVGERNALFAALASMLLPPTASGGPIYYPECALQLLLALMLGCMVRAMAAPGRFGWWALTGLCGGLGLFVHYRFALAGVGVLVFAAATAEGRRLWREPGFWLAGAIAATFAAPSVVYNLTEGLPALTYHGADRHGYRFNPEGFAAFLGMQAALCTPVFLAALAVAAWSGWRREPRARLLIVVAGVIFLTYAAHALIARRSMPQWPFLAYVPLLALLPAAAIRFVDGAATRRGRRWRVWLAWSAPVMSLAVFALATAMLVAYRAGDAAPLWVRAQLPTRFEDWTAVEPTLARAAADAEARFGGEPLLAAAGHVGALRLEFPGRPGRRVYALGEPNDTLTRFDVMRAAMGLDAAALARDAAGRPAVIVLPQPTFLYHTAEETAFRARLCRTFDDVRAVTVFELPPRRFAAEVYSATVRAEPAAERPCVFLPTLHIARPLRGEVLHAGATPNFYGMAASARGVARVDIRVDGRVVTTARMHLDPEGARAPAALAFDPDYPKVQFDFQLPAAALSAGARRVEARAYGLDGALLGVETRLVYVDP